MSTHFVPDEARIVAAIDPRPGDRVVEIGPGLGALSLPLLERCRRLEVIEIDRDVIPELQRRCAGAGELVVHQGDVLEMDIATLHRGGARLRVCGNLPYNISTPLLFHLLAARGVIADMLAASCRCEALFRVGRGAFQPPPAVDSAVVRLVPHVTDPFPLPDRERYARIVAAAFSMRRKTLRNGLRGLLGPAAFEARGNDANRRPETLSPAEFARLAAL
jgi:16S rRNA (adenine1518-N6/adenine1519-N6)-dimethyltransferase